MKKYLVLTMAAALLSGVAVAQERDGVDPLLSVQNKSKTLTFTAGGRFMMDAAYISSDYTPMRSGFAITDARVRTSLTYQNWYFYADFDFSYGDFKQKNIFARYSTQAKRGTHSGQFGYFADPSSMSYNTSRYDYHFINRPSSVYALAAGRSLGVSYKFYNTHVMLDQGVFAENKYNDQIAGFQGANISGRWVYRPINNERTTLHVGASLRYARINTGDVVNDVLQTNVDLKASLENGVDTDDRFLNASVPWAKDVLNIGVEALYKNERFFARGEYMFKKIWKERPDQTLFEQQLGGMWSWGTLESWQKGNPLRRNDFSGGYIEMGFLIKGDGYAYDNAYGLLKGNRAKNSMEVVARYNYTNLNDITDGDIFLIGRKQFYPGGVVSDYPAASTSVGGGKMHSATVGFNYTLNQYVKFMVDYTYSRLDNVYFPMDKNFHTAQLRMMFSF